MTDTSNFLELLAQAALMATDKYVVICVLMAGFIFLRKESFGRAFYILAFTMILNPFLKAFFQVPLAPSAGAEGWAFPSGHMQVAAAMWIWLAWEYKNKKFSYAVTALLCAIGFALIKKGYHDASDVAAAAAFAAITLAGYNYCLNKFSWTKDPQKLGLAIAALCVPLMILTPNSTQLAQVWLAFGGTIGFALGWSLSNKASNQISGDSIKAKTPIFLLAMLGTYGIDYAFDRFASTATPMTLTAQYLLVALWIAGAAQFCTAKFAKAKK